MILDFQVDEKVLAEDRQQDPTVADPAVIETTYFVMPVRFAVDARELLQTPSSAWLPQPVLGFATHLALSVGALRSTGTASCSVAGAGTLRFQQRGERVHLICSFNKIEVETPTTDLVVAVAHFRRRVEEVLRTRVPELATHSSWPSWFPES